MDVKVLASADVVVPEDEVAVLFINTATNKLNFKLADGTVEVVTSL